MTDKELFDNHLNQNPRPWWKPEKPKSKKHSFYCLGDFLPELVKAKLMIQKKKSEVIENESLDKRGFAE